ncbi:hypothetical protein BU24DRAFT_444743 [Aaosphaeria arxii CBS 175.79]|uniref:Cell surface spherulin 4-like protein n=1 Tax=Aaosphaeria arxii CBS 175.79 TaxID=1450172 RepID=A0A6A5XB29_9PLEO|nr:uncharacterized protein BU24DRAFT_444743 [Aaosphaeria arxii CBS 175.79]KAF2010103.1 hypothetical protein BU24DRAFT_444743 [Aaosphaeria arxii CBS 175.79]
MAVEPQNINATVAQPPQSKPKANVLLPLYIYPAPGAWDPLYGALSLHRSVKFTIIVNPSSGPGAPPWWPNPDYVREVPRLNAQPNAETVGYVKIDYCRRPLADVYADIDAYAKWSTDSRYPGLGVKGIFFDETPNRFTPEVAAYLNTITQRAKETAGLAGNRLVIHNPGTAVDATLAQPGPDLTTVVEDSFANYRTDDYQRWLATSPYNRTRSSYMVHSVPKCEVSALTHELRDRAEYLFVTDLTQAFYESFGPSWAEFVAAVAREDTQCSA